MTVAESICTYRCVVCDEWVTRTYPDEKPGSHPRPRCPNYEKSPQHTTNSMYLVSAVSGETGFAIAL